MTIKELQALSAVVDMLIEMSLGTKIPTDNVEQKLSDLDQAINRPPCDFCEIMKYRNYISMDSKFGCYDDIKCPVIYCPACGRVLRRKAATE